MGISVENGTLTIVLDKEIPIFIPEADFAIPKPPTIPTPDFPELPDAAKLALKLKADIDAQIKLQAAEPDLSIKISRGGSGGSGGGDFDLSVKKPEFDIDAYVKKMGLKIPTPPTLPSVDFPEPPDLALEALKIKGNLEAQLNLQGAEPDLSIKIGGGSGGDGSGGFDFKVKPVKPDIPTLAARLSPLPLPPAPSVPSVDFPALPTFGKFGDIGVDLDSIRGELNVPGSAGFKPGNAVVRANVYLKSRISRVKVI